jgi:hypothetical protein
MRFRSAIFLSLLLLMLPSTATALISFTGGSFQTSVDVTMPGCQDDAGDVLVSPVSVVCSAGGYSGVASAATGFSGQFDGGEVTASGEAEATSAGPPGTTRSSALSINTASADWTLTAPTHYSLMIESQGGAFVNFSGTGVPFPPPASGVLTGTDYGLAVSVNMSAVANDLGGPTTVVATPQSITAHLTLAEVGSPTLIMGTVLAGGAAMPGLLIEALDGLVVVATTRTASDGSYLLDGIGTSVTLRLSDPGGNFATESSPLLFPPATYNADLTAIASVPALGGALLVGLALTLTLLGSRSAARRTSAR